MPDADSFSCSLPLSRRRFLKSTALAGAALFLPAPLRADPYCPWPVVPPGPPVRIRGRVAARGRGLAGVAVTDGRTVVATEADGSFTLVADGNRPFVYCSIPAGYRIPQNPTGTARFYMPLRADARGEMTAHFDLEPLDGPDDRHAFLVLADPQTQDAYEMDRLHAETVPDVRATVAALGDVPCFGVACGDIMFDNLALYPDYERAVAAMGVPFFQVVGNHDLDVAVPTDEASTTTFQQHFGPTYYSFDRGEVHYVVLDDVFWHSAGYFGYLDAVQLGWLEQDLARVEPGRTVVVFVHIPALSMQYRREGQRRPPIANAITNRDHLYRLLEPFEAHIVSGHTHEHEHVFEGGVHEHICGTTCGAWWSGDLCHDGTPNGYAVFEADGSSLRWRYKATGHDPAHRLRVYARGADPTAPDEIVANVWDWMPGWTVVWYEGGERKGLMARRTGTDPRSERLHRGPDLPERRPWVEPARTDHLFYAPVAPGTSEIRVEATDPWGRTFTAMPEAP